MFSVRILNIHILRMFVFKYSFELAKCLLNTMRVLDLATTHA